MSTTTSPGPAFGSGRSPNFRTSGPPVCSRYAAFITSFLTVAAASVATIRGENNAGKARLLFLQQQRTALLDGRDEMVGQFGQQPGQTDLQPQRILEHLDLAIRRLAERANPEVHHVAVPVFALDRHELGVVRSRRAKPVFQPLRGLLLAEAMRQRHDQRRAHGCSRKYCRSSATLRRLARHITSKASPNSGTAPTRPSIATLA